MLQKFTLLLACFTLFSCSEEAEKKLIIPDTVLKSEKMADVMLDVQLLEATMSLNIIHADQPIPDSSASSTFGLFKKHEITKQVYDSSFMFYSQHPEVFAEIYQEVLESLSQMQAEVMNKKSDSLNLIN